MSNTSERRFDDALRAQVDAAMARTWDVCLDEAIARMEDLPFECWDGGPYFVFRYDAIEVLRAMKGRMPRSTPNPPKPQADALI